jgi:acyl-coenzyme A thioesterase PaaI-like protein
MSMIPKQSAAIPSIDQRIRARVLHAIACNRIAGLHFPGHFLGIEWREVAGGTARAELVVGPHCIDANGAVNIVVLGILADNMLAAVARTGAMPGVRLGTIHMQLQFTGATLTGDMKATSHLLGRTEGATLPQLLCASTIFANGKPVCYANGEYALLDAPPGVTLGPLPWERTAPALVLPVDANVLEPSERMILTACDTALAKTSSSSSFIQRFWGGVHRKSAQTVRTRVTIGPHIANRVGHVQGGILIGLAAGNACLAAPPEMMLSNVSAWYISPGRGTSLVMRSQILHVGRTFTVVHTEIKTTDGKRVLETLSNHVARNRN